MPTEAEAGRIVITPASAPRSGWAEAAAAAHDNADDILLDAPTATRFDLEEWTW